jgi:hypothetical protein
MSFPLLCETPSTFVAGMGREGACLLTMLTVGCGRVWFGRAPLGVRSAFLHAMRCETLNGTGALPAHFAKNAAIDAARRVFGLFKTRLLR